MKCAQEMKSIPASHNQFFKLFNRTRRVSSGLTSHSHHSQVSATSHRAQVLLLSLATKLVWPTEMTTQEPAVRYAGHCRIHIAEFTLATCEQQVLLSDLKPFVWP